MAEGSSKTLQEALEELQSTFTDLLSTFESLDAKKIKLPYFDLHFQHSDVLKLTGEDLKMISELTPLQKEKINNKIFASMKLGLQQTFTGQEVVDVFDWDAYKKALQEAFPDGTETQFDTAVTATKDLFLNKEDPKITGSNLEFLYYNLATLLQMSFSEIKILFNKLSREKQLMAQLYFAEKNKPPDCILTWFQQVTDRPLKLFAETENVENPAIVSSNTEAVAHSQSKKTEKK